VNQSGERGDEFILSWGDLIENGDYSLLSRFEKAVNFHNGDRLLSFVVPRARAGPVNVVVTSLGKVFRGDITVTKDYLILGDEQYQINPGFIYNSRLEYNSPGRTDRSDFGGSEDYWKRLYERLTIFQSYLEDIAGEIPTLSLLSPGGLHEGGTFHEQLIGILGKNVSGLLNSRGREIGEHIEGIKGLGVGLTPSGDDVLAGMLMALYIRGIINGSDLGDLRCRIFRGSRGNNPISNEFLYHAYKGRFNQPFKELMNFILGIDRGEIYNTTRAITSHGSSSGVDVAVGFILMMRCEVEKWNTAVR